MRFPAPPPAIASHDVVALRRASIRTTLLRIVLAGLAIALLALATAAGRAQNPAAPALLPGSGGVLVIDLSLSIGAEDYTDIRRTVRRLIDEDIRTGLVIFSDLGYELLPPGTPATELRPLLRLLAPQRSGRPINPWTQSFRAGTRISSALELAREMLMRDHVRQGSVLLLSDLITTPEDVPQLVRTIQELRRDSVKLQVVPLTPLKDGRAIFEGLLDKGAVIEPSQLTGADPVSIETQPAELPVGLLVFGGLLLVVLAAHEAFAGRLGLPTTAREART
jgi:hypothetical protein